MHVHPCCHLAPVRLSPRPLFRKPSMSSGIAIITSQIANSQLTPASRQPYVLLRKRPPLPLPAPASAGSSTNTLSQQRCRSVPSARLSASRQQTLSMPLAVPSRWKARQSLHKSTTFAEPRAEEWLWKMTSLLDASTLARPDDCGRTVSSSRCMSTTSQTPSSRMTEIYFARLLDKCC